MAQVARMGFGASIGTDGGLAAMREHADAEEDRPAGLTPRSAAGSTLARRACRGAARLPSARALQ